jgi:hypothetical protein
MAAERFASAAATIRWLVTEDGGALAQMLIQEVVGASNPLATHISSGATDLGGDCAAARADSPRVAARYCTARPEWDRGEHDYERSGPRPREVVFSRSTRAASRIADRIMVCRCWMSSRS